MSKMLGLLTAVLVLLAAAGQAIAAEVIRDYHADIALAPDATLSVTETITVRAEGQDIKRGIFRDFPLYAEDADGRRIKVDFDLVSVERDGEPEDYHTESISGGIRIYAGSADVFLDPGDYTYTITYTTGRQIRYFDDHDELYWNVTGNGWQFPILKASANVILPDGVAPTQTAYYTGYRGSTETNARYQRSNDGAYFETTEPLGIGDGLTIVVGLPKGVVLAPSSEKSTWWWLRDNINSIIGYGGLGLVFFYYLRSWIAVGRDPEAGVMVPRWDPPEGISPALVNYIDNKGFSGEGWTALSASLLDLAVKGYVVLDDLERSIVVNRTDKPVRGKLPAGLASLIEAIGGPGDSLTIDKANGKRVQSVGKKFRDAIEKEHRGKYYRGNGGYIFGGVALSVAALAALLIFGSLTEDTIGLLFAPVVISAFLGGFAVRLGRGVRRGAPLVVRIISIVGLAILGFVAVAMSLVSLLAIFIDLSEVHQISVLVAVGGIVLLNALFFFLMGAPTPVGRKLMDGIEGLRTYLTLAEKDRLNMQGAPKMSPQHFETLLPYAVALGVEKPWTETFDIWLASAAAGAAAASYQPAWYHGSHPGDFGGRIGGFSSAMASTIASTIPAPPKSSSSGFSSGGGSSGGGGGGGGGGGW
ncbi:DUF2207 domain-containing protein [Rhizobium sp. KAs_5_22]|uniref:DUF2207 domain-containing protein n=1 Tax=Ciceribacter selenitireducens TaxID=448181 RepID=UPI00048FA272|nr:DUF2207 domain-containing protein [Ciceribacter selenitireducens]PPJ47584.1 DUF2207 domain-containing protein [Rhizobium sp. KAs_5_22]